MASLAKLWTSSGGLLYILMPFPVGTSNFSTLKFQLDHFSTSFQPCASNSTFLQHWSSTWHFLCMYFFLSFLFLKTTYIMKLHGVFRWYHLSHQQLYTYRKEPNQGEITCGSSLKPLNQCWTGWNIFTLFNVERWNFSVDSVLIQHWMCPMVSYLHKQYKIRSGFSEQWAIS